MGPYSQLVPIFLLFGLAPLMGLIVLMLATMLRSPATRPVFLRGFTRVWLVAILVGAGLGLVGFVTGWVVYLLSR
jgi:hypothetical protein